MRARNLKPGYFRNELLGKADPLIGTLFQGLWCEADREGRLEDRPLRLCGTVFPYRRSVTEKKVEKMLAWLADNRFITRYEIDGCRYIQVIEFLKHQNPHSKEAPSKIPALSSISPGAGIGKVPDETGTSTGASTTFSGTRPASSLIPDSLIPDSSLRALHAKSEPSDGDRSKPEPGFAQVQAAYPEFAGKQSDWILAERACLQRIEEGATWEELEAAATRFAAFVAAGGRSGPQFVDLPSKFFGNGLWREEWRPPPTKADQRLASNLDAAAEFMRRTEPSR